MYEEERLQVRVEAGGTRALGWCRLFQLVDTLWASFQLMKRPESLLTIHLAGRR